MKRNETGVWWLWQECMNRLGINDTAYDWGRCRNLLTCQCRWIAVAHKCYITSMSQLWHSGTYLMFDNGGKCLFWQVSRLKQGNKLFGKGTELGSWPRGCINVVVDLLHILLGCRVQKQKGGQFMFIARSLSSFQVVVMPTKKWRIFKTEVFRTLRIK